MRTEYKHIRFEELLIDNEWACLNKKQGSVLATIEFYGSWNKFIVSFYPQCVFDESCLRDIADFLDQLNKGETE